MENAVPFAIGSCRKFKPDSLIEWKVPLESALHLQQGKYIQEKMALSVKAYIHPDTNQQEIRWFAIDEGVSASYAYWAQKIEQVFPVVRGKIFKLFWKGSKPFLA